MDQRALQDAIGRFLTTTFLFEFGNDVTPDTDLFDADLIDSYGFVELVTFLEQTYGVALSDEDLASKEMSTLAGIARLVAGRAAGASTQSVS